MYFDVTGHTTTNRVRKKSSGTKQLDCQRQDSSIEARPKPGYKIVIDNIGKNVKPRNMRIDAQTKSLHCVQMYSVKDRIDFGKLSDMPLSNEKCLYDLLPSTDDYEKVKEGFTVHVGRVMVEHIPFFSEDFSGLVERHIPHQYSHEMSVKSQVVSPYCTCIALLLSQNFVVFFITCS